MHTPCHRSRDRARYVRGGGVGATTAPSVLQRSANGCAGSSKAGLCRRAKQTTRPGVGLGPASGRSLGLGPQAGQADIAQAGRITKLALVPEEVRPDDGRQLGFWGNDAGAASRAARALARVQGLLGPEAAMTGILQGGRDYTEQVRLVPWGEPRVPLRPGVLTGGDTARGGVGPTSGSKGPPGATRRRVAGRSPSDFSEGAPEQSLPPVQRTAGDSSETQLPGSFSLGLAQAGQADDVRRGLGPSRQKGGHGGRGKDAAPPWPGRLPGLAPAIVHQPPLPALMVDEEGNPVTVGSRGTASARPARLRVGAGALIEIGTWAGPWPVEERWWDGGGRRRARFQVCTVDGAAYLLAREGRRWWVEATYD